MSERFYPPTEKELLKQRILPPQPSRVPYSPLIDSFVPAPTSKPLPAKPRHLPDGIICYSDPTAYESLVQKVSVRTTWD